MSENQVFKTEEQFQAAATQWYWNTFPLRRRLLFAVNNNSANALAGNRKKAVGVVKGVADLCLICPMGRVIFIELKLPGKTQKPEQIDFMRKVQDNQHMYVIVNNLEEFKKIIWQTIGKD